MTLKASPIFISYSSSFIFFFFSLSFPTQSVTNTDSALFALAAFPFHVNLTTADSVIDYEPAIKIMLLLGALHNVIR